VNAAAALSASTFGLPTSDGRIRGAKKIFGKKSGSVRWPEDVNDVYKRRLVKGQVWKVVLNGPNNADFDLWAYMPGAKDIWQGVGMFGRPTFDADEAFKFRVRKTGVYRFHVSAYPGPGGPYTLRLVRL
jgi:hypothetical protein